MPFLLAAKHNSRSVSLALWLPGCQDTIPCKDGMPHSIMVIYYVEHISILVLRLFVLAMLTGPESYQKFLSKILGFTTILKRLFVSSYVQNKYKYMLFFISNFKSHEMQFILWLMDKFCWTELWLLVVLKIITMKLHACMYLCRWSFFKF